MPLSYGIFPTKIFVPASWNNWTPECRKMIIQHEIAHIKRRDGLVQFFQLLVQALYFFHPLVWLLSKYINEYREMACDDASIISDEGCPIQYSKYLVEISENVILTQFSNTPVSALIKQKNKLLNRLIYRFFQSSIICFSDPNYY